MISAKKAWNLYQKTKPANGVFEKNIRHMRREVQKASEEGQTDCEVFVAYEELSHMEMILVDRGYRILGRQKAIGGERWIISWNMEKKGGQA